MMAALATISAGESPIPRERVISFWTGEPAASGTRLDEIGSNHLGNSAVGTTAAGKIGTATDFTGANYLRTTLSVETVASSLTSVGADITYAGWIRFDTVVADQTIAARWGGWAPGREHRLYLDAASARVKLTWANANNTASVTATAPEPIVAGQWFFVAYGRIDAASEIWVSVTPDSAATAQARTTVAAAATNPAAQAQFVEFGANNNTARMDGRWNLWGAYRCTLSAGELDWLFHGGSGRPFTDFAYVQAPALEYLHDFEQTGALCGRYSYQSLAGSTTISTEQARAGSASLKMTTDFNQIQVFNNSNTDYWCSTDECKVSSDIYVTTYVSGSMWFQIDGKSNCTDFDTNEGVSVTFRNGQGAGNTGNRGFSAGGVRTTTYNLPLNHWVHLTYLFKRNAIAPANVHELYADGVLIAAGGTAPATVTARAWHHISLGNDTATSPTFYIDNFAVRPTARLQDPPEIHLLPNRSALVGDPLAIATVVHDVDGDPLTFAWSMVSGPGGVAFGTPAAKDTTATFGAAGTYVIRLTVSDGGRTTTADCSVTASGGSVNAAPSISGGAVAVALATLEDATGTATLTGSDADGDPLSWSIQTQGAKGTAAVTASGSPVTVTYVPTAQANGADTVVVLVSDGQGGSDTITVNVAITAVNDAPSFSKGGNQGVAEDSGAQSVANWATALSAGPADEAGQSLTFTVTNSNNALFAVQPAVSATGTLTYTPATDAQGSATVSVTLGDDGGTTNGGSNTSAAQTFTITVTAANHAPVLSTAIPDQAAVVDAAFSHVVPALTFTDPDGDLLTWSASGLPAWLTFDAATRTLSGTPRIGDVGTSIITMTVTDPSLASAADSLVMIVSAATTAPPLVVRGTADGGSCGAGSLAGLLIAVGLLFHRRG